MKLGDIQSKQLIPRFAKDSAWVCNALDTVIKGITERARCIPAPLTMESIEALTDEELQAYYAQYNLAEYYPDVSREMRNRMLYEMARLWRYLGTPNSILELCKYLFDTEQFTLEIKDNLSFDDNGNPTHPELLNLFDLTINMDEARLSEYIFNRILANVFRFCRNTQTLRNIAVDFDGDFTQNVTLCGNINVVTIIETEGVAELPVMTFITVDGDGNITSGASEKCESVELITSLVSDESAVEQIPLDTMTVDEGDQIVQIELETTECPDDQLLIVPPIIPLLAYKQDGTTSQGEQYGDVYQVDAVDNDYHTEGELNALGWYVKWRVYTYSGAGSVDICDAPNGTVLATFGSGVNPIGNPYQITSGFQQIKFTEDNGATVQTGYFDTTTADLSYTEQIADDDIVYTGNFIDVLLGLKLRDGSWSSVDFNWSYDDYWWAGILSQEDLDRLNDFGLSAIQTGYPYGELGWNDNFTFEPLALYADVEGTQLNTDDMTNFYCDRYGRSGGDLVVIYGKNYSTASKTWLCRITKI